MKTAETGKQLWETVAQIKPHIESPQNQQAIEELLSVVAGDLFWRQVPVGTTETPKARPSPSTHTTPSDTFFDLHKKNTLSPSPSP